MATAKFKFTTKKTERVNLSVTTEERALLQRIAKDETRSMTWIAAFFVRFALDLYCNFDTSVKSMKNLTYDQLLHEAQSKKRLKLREQAQDKLIREENATRVPDNHETRKRA